jgi:phosphatidylserine decarboxylase
VSAFTGAWQRLIPQRLVCSFIYRTARTRRRWIKNPLIRWFAGRYRVDLREAETDSLERYPTFNAFFTRALRPGAHPIAAAPALVSPADGELTEFGKLDGATLLQAKGMAYTIDALLGGDAAEADAFRDGHYATVYLAPHDYHRVHAPLDGALTLTRYLPGERFCVNRQTTTVIGNLFCRNERVVCRFETAAGPAAVVLIGALNVSSLSTTAHGEIRSGTVRSWREEPPARYARGAEIGCFNLGSTVVVVVPAGAVRWRDDLGPGTTLRMGEALGVLEPPAPGAR